MRIFIAGATGALGRPLVRRFVEAGHEVRGLVRGEAGADLVRRLGGTPVHASLFDADALTRAAAGADVVIHAATAIPTAARSSLAAWAPNDRIRREGTEALTTAAARVGAGLYVQQSVVWVAQAPDGAAFDETSPAHPGVLVRSAHDGERIARAAGERHGFATVVLRLGGFYAADAPHTRMMAAELRRRRLPIVGRGDTILAPLHTDDAARAVVAAVAHGRAGLWHVVDDGPVPMAEFLDAFARLLGAPPPRHVPVWLARLAAGALTVEALTTSMRTTNARFRHDTGWAPRYATFREGLAAVLAEWAAEPPVRRAA